MDACLVIIFQYHTTFLQISQAEFSSLLFFSFLSFCYISMLFYAFHSLLLWPKVVTLRSWYRHCWGGGCCCDFNILFSDSSCHCLERLNVSSQPELVQFVFLKFLQGVLENKFDFAISKFLLTTTEQKKRKLACSYIPPTSCWFSRFVLIYAPCKRNICIKVWRRKNYKLYSIFMIFKILHAHLPWVTFQAFTFQCLRTSLRFNADFQLQLDGCEP